MKPFKSTTMLRPLTDAELQLEDKWILSKLNRAIREITENMDRYELGVAAQKIYDFIWDDYCDWYIELTKTRLQGEDEDSKVRAQQVLCHVLTQMLKLLHPFMPFITEEIWQALPHEGDFLMLSDWPVADAALDFPEEEKAMELIEELYVRVTSNVWFQSTQMAYIFGGYYRYPHLDVGGLDENGRDASNELSYLCLRAMRYAKTTSPAVSLLLHQKTPDSLLYEACELAAEGMGHPSFFNCEGLYSMLEHRAGGLEGYSHYTRKDILKFGSPIGCVEPGAEGLQYGHTDSGIINVAGAALMAVTNGVMPEESDNMFAGKLLTFESGAPGSFQTFEAFYDAVKAQIKYAIDEAHANLLICEKLLAEQFNLPTFTVLLEGALEKGKDATAGGAKVNVGPTMNMCGFGTMVDSVAAIKKVVFEDRAATLEEVCAACMQNFVGYEDLRTKLQAAPKYGNDDDFADAIAADLWKWFSTCTMRLKMYRGHYCDAAVQMVQSNVGYGAMTGATPNGRLAGMPLSDTMSATQQADTHGPTAAARSYGKLDFPAYTNGTLLNMWISQSELIEQS